MRSVIALNAGDKIGRLTLISQSTKNNDRSWICLCDCGKECNVIARSLRRGTKSCGCIRVEMFVNRNTKHGLTKSPLYSVWEGMMARCYRPKHDRYKNYGGRGIIVCVRWHDFGNFYEDVHHGYQKELTLDRPDVNGNYDPKNFKWSTQKEQGRNRTNNRIIACNGQEKTLAEWAELSPVGDATILYRLSRGWSNEDAVFKPNQLNKNK